MATIRKKAQGDLKRSTYKLQPNEELRLIVGKTSLLISIASTRAAATTSPKSKR